MIFEVTIVSLDGILEAFDCAFEEDWLIFSGLLVML